jgi:ComF family protein
MRLFSRMLEVLFPPRHTERLVRHASKDALAHYGTPHAFTMDGMPGVALLPYNDPLVHAAILEAKFRGNAAAQRLLGEALGAYLKERRREDPLRTLVLVPIPLSEERRKERGYNQTEEVCRYALQQADGILLMPEAVRRVRDTVPQTTLSGAARRKNLAGAFSAPPSLTPLHTYICIDDVITTGTTLLSAVTALRAAGATSIVPLALAQ